MSSTGNDFSHCLHGSPIVEKPRFSKDSKSTISSCKSDANKKENPHRHIVDKSRWGPSYSQRGEPYVHPNQLFHQCKPDAKEKNTPIDPAHSSRWGQSMEIWGANLISRINSCKPDAKKKPPLTSPAPKANGGEKHPARATLPRKEP